MLVYMADVTQILSQIEQGDRTAAEQLLPLVYEELRRLSIPCGGKHTCHVKVRPSIAVKRHARWAGSCHQLISRRQFLGRRNHRRVFERSPPPTHLRPMFDRHRHPTHNHARAGQVSTSDCVSMRIDICY